MTDFENKLRKISGMPTTRREFLKFCGTVAAALGLGPLMGAKVAEALTSGERPPVLWLHFAECTGCTEAFLRTVSPYADEVLLDVLSVDYHETIMAGAGETVREILYRKSDQYQGEFFCVVEGSIPTADGGFYGMMNDKTMLEVAQEICPKAKAVLNIGNCSSYGGLAAAEPNPTGAMGLVDALPNLDVPVVNVPGCPPNPITFVAVIADYLLNGTLPSLDSLGRPLFAYEKTVHSYCPYNFPLNKKCLKNEGCKGQRTFNNCPDVKFNEGTSFPMQAGHPCIGCSEPGFWDTMTPVYGSSGLSFLRR